MKFIVVDDEEICLLITKKLLADVLKVEEVDTYNNAGEALRYLKNYNSCETLSIFLDLNMPIISGWDFLEFFDQFDSELKNRVHIYVLTSSIDPRDKIRALQHPNVISFISKPITRTIILETFAQTDYNRTAL